MKWPKYSETKRLDLSHGIHRAVFYYLLLFDSLSMVYEGLCGEISSF